MLLTRETHRTVGKVAAPARFQQAFAALAAAALAIWFGGCRLPCGGGAVTDDVLTCRQLSQLGIREMEAGNWRQAETLMAKSVATCPDDADARRHYAEALWQRGARTDAVAEIIEAIRLADTRVDFLVRYSEMRLEMGQIELARQGAERAVTLDPESAQAYALRARVLGNSGQPRRALADYHRALSLQPNQTFILLELAEQYWRGGQPGRALANARSYLVGSPEGTRVQHAHFLAGKAQLALRRPEDAMESLAAAAGHGPPNADIQVRLAEAQWMAGRRDDARRVLLESLRTFPEHRPSLALLDRLDRH